MSSKYFQAILLVLFLLILQNARAQFINFGQDRASLRWKQIRTEDFQIIYPGFYERNAQKIANIFDGLYRHANTLGHRPGRISVIVHPDGGISNGNVAWAPRKSELYTASPQQPTDSWLEHLCVHEFRHVVQLDKINRGLTKVLYYLFGDIFPIAVTGAYLPMWFLEGDAVCFESSAGEMGRGRSPEFLNEMKAQIVEKGIYSYSKATLGSFRDHVPNRYNMGYFMAANTRLHYGSSFWSTTLDHIGRHPFGITSFSGSIARQTRDLREEVWKDSTFRSLFINPDSVRLANTSKDAKQTLYLDNFSELRQLWKREAETVTNRFDSVAVPRGLHADYLYPQPLPDGSVIAYKKGMEESGAFVRIAGGKEKIVVRTGQTDDTRFALDGKRLVWSEYRPHPRWEQAGRMRLSSYDLTTGRYRRTRGGRNSANQYSPFCVGKDWGYVEVDRNNRSSLVIAGPGLDQEKWRLEAGEDELFIHPSAKAGKIVCAVQSPDGMRLEEIDIRTRARKTLLAPVRYEVDNPVALDDGILFRASFNGNNAFYRLAAGGRPELVLEGRYGLRFPHYRPEDGRLDFSFYTSDGYRPGTLSCIRLEPQEFTCRGFRLADSMKVQENYGQDLHADSTFSTRRYRKLPHLLNFHSWGPVCVDLNGMDVDFGAVVYSQNRLSTLSLTAGFIRKSGYSHGAWMANLTYSGLWPVVSLEVESGRDRMNNLEKGICLENDSTVNLLFRNRIQHTEGEVMARFPFNLSTRQYHRQVSPYLRYKVEAVHNLSPRRTFTYLATSNAIYLQEVDHRNYLFKQSPRYYQLLEYGILLNNQTRMHSRESQPRWRQQFSAAYARNLNHGLQLGDQWWMSGMLGFPGIGDCHSLSVYGGFQQMKAKKRNYGNQILYPRGTTLYGHEIASIRSTYTLPLWYPDRQFGSLFYFKRINAALFYDWGYSRNKVEKEHLSSFGLELATDGHLLRLPYPIHIGCRAGYQDQTRKMFADLLLSIGINI